MFGSLRSVSGVAVGLLGLAGLSFAADVTVTSTRNQTIDGFGTCIAWWMNEPYSSAAFSDMYAKDMGCSILRVEIHPNATVAPGYELTNTPPIVFTGVLADDIKKLNFNAQGVANAGNLAKAVAGKKLDGLKLVGSLWTPPHWMKTTSGPNASYIRGRGNGGESINGHLIDTPENRTQFARYVAAFVKGFEQAYGVPFYAISMQNEPAFPEPYNSCIYYCTGRNGRNEYVAPFKAIGAEFARQGIATVLMGPEDVGPGSAKDPWIGWNWMQYMNDLRADPDAMKYLKGINIHGYGADGVSAAGSNADLWKQWWNGRDSASSPDPAGCWWTGVKGDVVGKGRFAWQTETSGDQPGWLSKNAAGNYNGALSLGVTIHEMLVHGNLNAYLYWQMADGEANGEASSYNLTGGTNTQAKKYNAAKHYFRYVRPGAVRLTTTPDTGGGLYVSAYAHDVNKTLTVVCTNINTAAQTVNLKLPASGVPLPATFGVVRRTSDTETWATIAAVGVSAGTASFVIPAQSIMTLQGTAPAVVAPTLRPADNPASTVAGLNYRYVEGSWSAMPDFGGMTAKKTGSVLNFDVSPKLRADAFGFEYTGYVSVPSDGTYSFFTRSDDGSKLWIGDTLVVNNDGKHSPVEKSGTIGLKAGKHALRVGYFDVSGTETLQVSFSGPGVSMQTIPATRLFRLATTPAGKAVNAGGPVTGTWLADVGFSGGTASTPWTGTISTAGVLSPAPAAVYRSQRSGASFSYTLSGLGNGAYRRVRLHFAENQNAAAGLRKQDVTINGTKVLTGFDPFAAAGNLAHKAVVREFTVAATASGQIVVKVQGVTGSGIVNGIEVR